MNTGVVMMNKIELKQVYKKYNGAENFSVEDFNLEIDEHEFIVFVGPSGCGKSTTLRMIAGLEDITQGELLINGERMNDVAPKDRGMAMVFQNYALYPHLSVFDNMAFSLQLRKYDKKEIKKRVEAAAESLGLSDYLDRKPSDLSGGQRQRVALGRAIVRDSKIFLMDEPLSNLDAKLRVQMRTEIARLHKRLGATTIYVTHDQTEAMTLADRIVIMRDGIVQQIGTPSELYDKPLNVFVAGFMGSPPMNFLNVTFEKDHLLLKNGCKVGLLEPQKKLLLDRNYEGKEIILGIRPEDIKTEQIVLEAYPDDIINLTVEVSEMTGSETMLYSDIAGEQIIAKVDRRDYIESDKHFDAVFDKNKMHFFDKDTERVIRK